jgi:hypothetical protein
VVFRFSASKYYFCVPDLKVQQKDSWEKKKIAAGMLKLSCLKLEDQAARRG